MFFLGGGSLFLQTKSKGQQLKGKIVSALFHTFWHFSTHFTTKPFCTFVVARLSSPDFFFLAFYKRARIGGSGVQGMHHFSESRSFRPFQALKSGAWAEDQGTNMRAYFDTEYDRAKVFHRTIPEGLRHTNSLLNALNSEDRGLKVRFSLAFDRESAQISQMLSSQGKNAPSNPYPHYLVR